MRRHPRPFDIVHVSSAHPWTDNRVHLRGAATAAAAGYRTALVAVESATAPATRDWDRPDPETGVWVRRLRVRSRRRRVLVSTVQAVRAALSSRALVVHLHDPELVWAVPLLRTAGRRVVYDAHEDLPDQVMGKDYLGAGGRSAALLLAHVVVRVARRADAVVAATPAIARRFRTGRTTVVRNLPVLRPQDEHAPPIGDRPARAVYLGSLSADRGLAVLAGLAVSGLPEHWQLVTAGPIAASDDRATIDALVGAGQIDHRGVLPPAGARDLLASARIGLLPLLPTAAYAASIPTKLFEYMAAGLAVVATDIPFWRELLDGIDCVTWVPAGDPAAVSRAVERYAADPGLLAAHAAAGRAGVAERFRWDHEAPSLLAVYARFWPCDPFGRRKGI